MTVQSQILLALSEKSLFLACSQITTTTRFNCLIVGKSETNEHGRKYSVNVEVITFHEYNKRLQCLCIFSKTI